MITFYYSLAPNPMKVALCLEEAGLDYEAIPVDTRKGEQHAPDFARLNPNHKVPVIVDGDKVVFDSNAILLYLGEKTGRFVPADRAGLLSWMMFIATGIGPYSGQCVHFRHFAPEPKEYGVTRYTFEAKRHWGIIEEHLTGREWMVGDDYSVVDMALWGWARMLPFILGAAPTDDSVWINYPNVKRLLDKVSARPAAVKALGIKDRHTFKAEFDAEARRSMFQHIAN
jgi:GST-like protein